MKNTKKITSILIVAIITMGMLVGCGSKTTATTTATAATAQKHDSSAMKTTYSTVLKALVTDKTITQVQSDKVLALVVKDIPTGGGRPSGTDKQGGTNSKNNQLASLVTSKVITQVQANTISTKVQAAMKSMQGTKTN